MFIIECKITKNSYKSPTIPDIIITFKLDPMELLSFLFIYLISTNNAEHFFTDGVEMAWINEVL